MREELLDTLTAVGIVILFIMLIGFAGWVTMEPRIIEQPPEVKPPAQRYLHGARAL